MSTQETGGQQEAQNEKLFHNDSVVVIIEMFHKSFFNHGLHGLSITNHSFREVMVAVGFRDEFTRQRDLLLQADVGRRGTDLEYVGAWSHVPAAVG